VWVPPRTAPPASSEVERLDTGHYPGMAEVSKVINAPRDAVFAVLADGWTYSDWVVGTVHIRDVDASWPAVGAKIHHKAGPWPLSLWDHTEVLESTPPSRLVLRARLWPLGEARVHLTLESVGERATRVTIGENFAAGPLRWVENKLNDLVMHGRNRESLRRLADIAARREAGGGPDASGGTAHRTRSEPGGATYRQSGTPPE